MFPPNGKRKELKMSMNVLWSSLKIRQLFQVVEADSLTGQLKRPLLPRN